MNLRMVRNTGIATLVLAVLLAAPSLAQSVSMTIESVSFYPPNYIIVYGTAFGANPGLLRFGAKMTQIVTWKNTEIQATTNWINPIPGTYLVAVQDAAKTSAAKLSVAVPVSSVGVQWEGVLSVTGVSLNGTGNQIHVPPGASVTVTANYSIRDYACPGCVDQILVGLDKQAAPQGCMYNGQPGPTGVTAGGSFTLIAPSAPGTYFVVVDRGQDFGCPTKWWNGPPTPERFIGAISVY